MTGKPVARMGDRALDCADPVETPSGVVVAEGTVFVNGLPAAKEGDRIAGSDIHVELVSSPGGPLAKPMHHAFDGPIDQATEPSVRIMGRPAAVVGSTATNTPPHMPREGFFQVPPTDMARVVTGSPDVFIGARRSAAGDPGARGTLADGIFDVSGASSLASGAPRSGHYLRALFTDRGGYPVVGAGYRLTDPEGGMLEGYLSGAVHRDGLPEGAGEVHLWDILQVSWGIDGDLSAGKQVALRAHTSGVPDGTPARFEVWTRRSTFVDTRVASLVPARVHGDAVTAAWTFPMPTRRGDGRARGARAEAPDYYFTVRIADKEKRSGVVSYRDEAAFVLRCVHGFPLGGVAFEARLPSGEVRRGRTDAQGRAAIGVDAVGNVDVTFVGLATLLEACRRGVHPFAGAASAKENGDRETSTKSAAVRDLAWSAAVAELGAAVQMSARVSGVPDRTQGTIRVFEVGLSGADDCVAAIPVTVSDGRVRAVWQLAYEPSRFRTPTLAELKAGTFPMYYFTVALGGVEEGINRESKLLTLRFRQPEQVPVLTFDGPLFNADGAALMPAESAQDRGGAGDSCGLDMLVTIYRHLFDQRFAHKKLLIAAHTAAAGSDEHNLVLAEARARSVYYLLVGDKDAWVATVESRGSRQKDAHRNMDIRRALRWIDSVSASYDRLAASWECDPGVVDGSPVDARMRDAIANFRKGYCDAFDGPYRAPAAGAFFWGWRTEGDDSGWGAVYDLFQAEVARRVRPFDAAECRARARAAVALAGPEVGRDGPCLAVGCGRERPLTRTAAAAAAAAGRGRNDRRIEVAFFDPDAAEALSLPCREPDRNRTACNTDRCPLFGARHGNPRVEMIHWFEPPRFVYPTFSCRVVTAEGAPRAGGETLLIDNLFMYAVRYDARGRLCFLAQHKVIAGKLFDSEGVHPRQLPPGPDYYFYFSNRGDLGHRGDTGDMAPALSETAFGKGGRLPLIGPVNIPADAAPVVYVDMWAQGDWIRFWARPLEGEGPHAVRLADGFAHYQLGRAHGEKPLRWRPFRRAADKEVQERWLGTPGLIDLVRIGEADGIPLLAATTSLGVADTFKVVLVREGEGGPLHVGSFNEVSCRRGNVDLPGHHTYNKDLVDALEALGTQDQPEAAVSALPAPPERCLLPGDICWQDQGETNLCAPYSIAAVLGYWLPYTRNPLVEDGRVVAAKIPDYALFGAYHPGQLVDGVKEHYPAFECREHDTEGLPRSLTLKVLKLWLAAGVPLIMDVKEASDARPVRRRDAGRGKKFDGVHFKVLVGYDGDRFFFNNSALDLETALPNEAGAVDRETAPLGNEVDSGERLYEKLRAMPNLLDLLASHEGCDFIALYPRAPLFQRREGVRPAAANHNFFELLRAEQGRRLGVWGGGESAEDPVLGYKVRRIYNAGTRRWMAAGDFGVSGRTYLDATDLMRMVWDYRRGAFWWDEHTDHAGAAPEIFFSVLANPGGSSEMAVLSFGGFTAEAVAYGAVGEFIFDLGYTLLSTIHAHGRSHFSSKEDLGVVLVCNYCRSRPGSRSESRQAYLAGEEIRAVTHYIAAKTPGDAEVTLRRFW